jgi:osmotically-inducible protein OsmY
VGGVLGLTRPAPAQSPQVIPGRLIATSKTGNEGNAVRPDGRKDAEKMKVELALLADLTTFPYSLDGRVAGDHLELHGYVPNNMVRQRALDIARRNTSLQVIDGLRLQAGLAARPALRGPEVLQTGGAELLRKHLGDSARGIRVEARSDGVVTLTGSINSIEDKLAVCKRFRQLSGCAGVIDQLTVRPILHDGQRVVPVTNDGALIAPPTAAMPKPVQPASRPSAEPAIVSTSKPAPSSLDARGDELRLPTIVTGKSAKPKSATDAAKHDEASSLKPPAPLMKWGQSTPNPETAKSAEKPSKAAAKTTPALTKPVVPWAADSAKKAENDRAVKPPPPAMKWGQSAMSWEPQVKPKPSTDVEKPASKPAKKSKPDVFASEHRPGESGRASTGSSVALTTPKTPPRWQRAGASEESEPRVESAPAKGIIEFDEEPVKKPAPAPAAAPKPPVPRVEKQPMPKVIARKTPAAGPPPVVERRIVQESTPPSPRRMTPTTVSPLVRLDRPSRWPPAYDIRPAEPKNGRPGLITFDEEPAPVKGATATTRPVVPTELRQRITAVCGRQAREVRVEPQRDGSVQVRVRVTSSSIGDQLTNKILTIPEMASPNVRLTMDIAP